MLGFVIFLIACFAIATATALIRGLFAFYRDGEAMAKGGAEAHLRRGMQQNRMMTQRVLFQGLAILAIALVGALVAKN